MGCGHRSEECDDDERPGRSVWVDAFVIDRTEVRVADFARCVQGGGCAEQNLRGYQLEGGGFVLSSKCNWRQPHRERHPMNCVSWTQALSYCEWAKKRLPTEAEWERAARGDDQRLFPWGDDPAGCSITVMAEGGDDGCGNGGTWPVGAKARDVGPFGTFDMAGNVREWVADWYDPAYYRDGPDKNPRGPANGTRRVARGGGWGNVVGRFLRASAREGHDPKMRSIHVGFRCARSG